MDDQDGQELEQSHFQTSLVLLSFREQRQLNCGPRGIQM